MNAISNNPDHPTITQYPDQIHTVCRCCNRATLDTFPQTTWSGDRFYMVTCWQLDCGMTGISWDDPTYGSLNLALYGASQHPDYREPRS